jgi:AcrR family transcriptional regulator
MRSALTDDRTTKAKSGTAVRQRGITRAENILEAAQKILINEGLAALSLRRIADSLDISNGNVTYYYPNKDALLRALIEDLLGRYANQFELESKEFPGDPEGRFLAYVDYLIDDCRNADVRSLFYQIWSIATHNEMVAGLRDHIYEHFLAQAETLVRHLNPGARKQIVRDTAMVIIAMIEGLHVVFGLNPATGFGSATMQKAFRNHLLSVARSASGTQPRG